MPKIKLMSGDPLFKSFLSLRKIVNPKRDWKILLTLLAVFIILSVAFDFYMYQQISSGDMYIDVNKEDLVVENLQTDSLQKIINNFEAKKEKTANLKLENLIDPSI